MGAWGTGLYQDDVALDVRDEYKDKLHRGKTDKEVTEEMIDESQYMVDGEDDTAIFWFALADTQWNMGRLEERVKEQALKYIESGIDLKRWEEEGNLKNLEKRKKVLEELKKKLLLPQPEKKKVGQYRIHKCEWKLGDTFAYKLESEYAKEKGLYGRYLIIIKVDEGTWWPGHIIPIVRVKITKDEVIPKTESEINKLEYIQINCTKYKDRFDGRDASIPLEEQIAGRSFETDEYGLLPRYMASMIITSKSMLKKNELKYLGNYQNIIPPVKEFIPLHKLCISTIMWQNLEKEIIATYFGHNKREYKIYEIAKKEMENDNV